MKDKIKNNHNSVIQDSAFESATDEQKIRALNMIIDRESEKPENEVDMELINSCMDMIEEIHGGVRERSDRELNEAVSRITSSDQKRRPAFKLRRLVRVACAVLVIAVILGAAVTVMAKASGYSSAFEWVSDHIKEVLGWAPGAHDIGGITVYRGESSEYYDSIEEMLREKNLDILYPSAFPNGIKLQAVSITDYDSGDFTITFIFDTDSISFSVYNFDLSLHIFDCEETVTVNGIEYRISHFSEWYQADYVTDKYAYALTSRDYDDLIFLLNSMKECD